MVIHGNYHVVPLWDGKSRVWYKDSSGYYQVVFEGTEEECMNYAKKQR